MPAQTYFMDKVEAREFKRRLEQLGYIAFLQEATHATLGAGFTVLISTPLEEDKDIPLTLEELVKDTERREVADIKQREEVLQEELARPRKQPHDEAFEKMGIPEEKRKHAEELYNVGVYWRKNRELQEERDSKALKEANIATREQEEIISKAKVESHEAERKADHQEDLADKATRELEAYKGRDITKGEVAVSADLSLLYKEKLKTGGPSDIATTKEGKLKEFGKTFIKGVGTSLTGISSGGRGSITMEDFEPHFQHEPSSALGKAERKEASIFIREEQKKMLQKNKEREMHAKAFSRMSGGSKELGGIFKNMAPGMVRGSSMKKVIPVPGGTEGYKYLAKIGETGPAKIAEIGTSKIADDGTKTPSIVSSMSKPAIAGMGQGGGISAPMDSGLTIAQSPNILAQTGVGINNKITMPTNKFQMPAMKGGISQLPNVGKLTLFGKNPNPDENENKEKEERENE